MSDGNETYTTIFLITKRKISFFCTKRGLSIYWHKPISMWVNQTHANYSRSVTFRICGIDWATKHTSVDQSATADFLCVNIHRKKKRDVRISFFFYFKHHQTVMRTWSIDSVPVINWTSMRKVWFQFSPLFESQYNCSAHRVFNHL